MNYNRNMSRFMRNQPQYDQFGNMVNVGMQLMGGKEGGLLGQAGVDPTGYSVQKGDTFSEIAASNNISLGELMRLNPELAEQEGGYDALSIGQNIQMDEGMNPSGLLGSAQSIGKGVSALDKALGGYGKKAVGKLAESGIGQFVKGKATEVMGSSAVQGLGSFAATAGPIVGAIMAVKGIDDAADATIDKYGQLETGIQTGMTMQTDLKSRFKEAKNNLLSSQNKIKEMVQERKGNLVSRASAQAEQVLSTGDKLESRSNLESSDSTNQAITKSSEGLIDSYLDNSNALQKQMEKMNTDQLAFYRRNKSGLIAEGQDLQANIDALEEQKDNMETNYKLASGWKKATSFGLASRL